MLLRLERCSDGNRHPGIAGSVLTELLNLLGCPVPRESDPSHPPAHPQSEVATSSPHGAGLGCLSTPWCCGMGTGGSASAASGLSLGCASRHDSEAGRHPLLLHCQKALIFIHFSRSTGPPRAGSSGWLRPPPRSLKLAVISDLLESSLSGSNGQIHPFPAQKQWLMGMESWALLAPLLCRVGGIG